MATPLDRSLFRSLRLALVLALVVIALGNSPLLAQSRKMRVLYVTQSLGFRHQSLHLSQEIMEKLGATHGFEVTLTQMAEQALTPAAIKKYDAIIFYTTGELPLSESQKGLFLDWIREGGFFMGLHSATDTYYQWPAYGEMINGWFDGHPWTQNTEVTVRVDDRTHPVTRHLPESMTFQEEIYQLKNFDASKVKVLVSLDTTKTNMTLKGIKAKEFPLVYHRDYGKGKVLYNAFGHRPDIWTSAWYQTMIVEALKWGTGRAR